MSILNKIFGKSLSKLTPVKPFSIKNIQAGFTKMGLLYRKDSQDFYFEVQMPGTELNDWMGNIRIAISMHQQLADKSHYEAVWKAGSESSLNYEGKSLNTFKILQARITEGKPLLITVYSDKSMAKERDAIMEEMPQFLLFMGQSIDNLTFTR